MTDLAQRMADNRQIQRSSPGRNVFEELDRLKPQIARALPKALDPDRFLRLVLTQIRTNRGLLNCSSDSLLGAVLSAAQLGLEIDNRGLAYLIPRGGQVTFQIGYRGLIDLATRSGRVSDIKAVVVYQNEFFYHEEGLKPKLKHKPLLEDRGEPIAAYAVAHYPNGKASFVVLSHADIEKRRKRGAGTGAWSTDWDAMARKSAVRALSAFLPQNPELALAFKLDEQVRTDITTAPEDLPDPDDVSHVDEAVIEIPDASDSASGEPEESHTSDDGSDEAGGPPAQPPASPPDELDSLKVDQLRAICDESKLTNTGSKLELIARIREHNARPFS